MAKTLWFELGALSRSKWTSIQSTSTKIRHLRSHAGSRLRRAKQTTVGYTHLILTVVQYSVVLLYDCFALGFISSNGEYLDVCPAPRGRTIYTSVDILRRLHGRSTIRITVYSLNLSGKWVVGQSSQPFVHGYEIPFCATSLCDSSD